MKILSHTVSKNHYQNGKVSGKVIVLDDNKKRHTVKFDFDPKSNVDFEQWGANTDILCFTYGFVEKLCYEGYKY